MPNVITINRADVIALIEEAAKKLTGGNKTEAVALAVRRLLDQDAREGSLFGAHPGSVQVRGGCRLGSARSRRRPRCRDRPRDRSVTDTLLLDTHIVLWLDAGDDRLRPETHARIDACWQHGGTICVSAITAWEMAALDDTGRIDL